MLLKQRSSGHLVEVKNTGALINPYQTEVDGLIQWGEDLADPELLSKKDLCFPSGENLPKCWQNSHYRDHEIRGQSARLKTAGIAADYYGA